MRSKLWIVISLLLTSAPAFAEPDGQGNHIFPLAAAGLFKIMNEALTTSYMVLEESTGNVGIGDSTPTAMLTVGSGDLFQVNSSGAIAAATGITSSGTITFSGLSAGGIVSAGAGTGTLSVGTLGGSGITPDSLDFTEFQDTLDLDADLILNQTTNTWSQTFTGTTTTGLTYTANSLTTGAGISVASSATGLAGDLSKVELTGANAGNTGNVLKVGYTGTTGTATPLNVTNAGTGLSVRINDDGTYTDTTAFVIDASGNVGIGDTSPASLLTVGSGDLFQVNSSGDLVKIKNVAYVWPSSSSSGVLTNDGTGGLTWTAPQVGDITSVGDVTTGAAFDGTQGNSLQFEGATPDGFETTLTAADATADRTITLPNVTGTVVTTGDTGTVTSTMIADGTVTSTDITDGTIATGDIASNTITGSNVADDTFDFVDFEDTLDLDANLTLNQTTNTWSQSFTGTTTTGLIYTADSLTTGAGISVASAATGLTGDLGKLELTGANAGNTGNVLKVGYTGTTGTATPLNVTNGGTGLSLRVNDDGTYADTTAFVVDASGNVGVGTSSPAANLEVSSNAGRVRITQNTSGGVLNGIDFANYNNTAIGGLLFNQSSGEIRLNATSSYFPTFYSNGSEVMRINTSGNVGIGDTSPASLLTVGSGDLFQVNSSGAVAAATGITSSGTITFSGLTAGGVVSAGAGTGTLTVGTLGGAAITPDSLDFTEFQDTLDLDADLVLNQTTNTWSQSFTGTTTTGLTYTASSLTSGVGVNITSAATGMTGDISKVELTGANAGNTGNVLKVGYTGTTGTATPLNVTNGGTGLSFRVNDDGTYADTSAFVIDASGKVGIGDSTPAALLTVGDGDPFQVDASGNLVRVNGVNYKWPGLQGAADTILTNNGSGDLAWTTVASLVTLQSAYDNGPTITTADATNLQINLADTATDSNFVVASQANSEGYIHFTKDDDATPGSSMPTQLILVQNQDVDDQLNGAINIQGVFKYGVNVSYSSIDTALAFGDNNIAGNYFAIDGSTGNINLLKNVEYDWPSSSASGVLTNDGTGGLTWVADGGGDITSVGDVTSGAAFDGTQGNSLQFEGSVADGFETTLTAANPTADRTITIPNIDGTLITTGDSDTVSSTMIADETITGQDIFNDTLDFIDFEDTLDLDANLTLNQAANTWSQTFTGTTTTGLTYTADSLTTGTGISVASAATGLTGNLTKIELSGANTGNTGDVLKVGFTGTTGTATPLNVTNGGTGLSLRVNDDGTYADTSAFVVDASGNVGVGTTNPTFPFQVNGKSYLAGRVGIDTAPTDSYHLEVASNSSGRGAAKFTNSQANATVPILLLKAGSTPSTGGDLLRWTDSSDSVLGVIAGSGNIGVGDSTPASMLTVGSGDLFQVNSSGDLIKIDNVTYDWPSSQGGSGTVLTNNGSGVLSWGTPQIGDITSVGDVTSGAAFDGTQGNSLQFEGVTPDGFETTLTADDPTADRTITLPNVTGTLITTGDTGTVTSTMLTDNTITGTDTADDTFDFVDFEDTLDLDAALVLNQTTNTWSQSFTGTTTTGLTYTASSLTSGVGVNITSAATGMTGDIGKVELTGANAGNTGNVLKVGFTGTTGTATALNVTNAGTGLSLRVNDDGTYSDTTAVVVDASGNVGIGTSSPRRKLQIIDSSGVTAVFTHGANNSAGTYSGMGFGYFDTGNNLYQKSAIVQEQTGDAAARGKIHILNNNQNGSNSVSLSDARLTVLPSGEIGIGDTDPASMLTVGSGDLFQVNSSGDMVKIKNVTYSWPSSNSSGVLTNDGTGGLTWVVDGGGDITSVGDVTTGAAFDGTQGNSLQFEGSVADGFETTLTTVNPTADRTIILPNIDGTLITTGDSDTVSSTMIADETITGQDILNDTLDFIDFEDTLDLDANLTLNQAANTWSQTFTGTTATGLTYTADNLTSGAGLRITSATTALTGDLQVVELTGADTGNTGNVLKLGVTDVSTATVLNVTNAGTGITARFNDDGTYSDATPVIIDDQGRLGIGRIPASRLEVSGDGSELSMKVDPDNSFIGMGKLLGTEYEGLMIDYTGGEPVVSIGSGGFTGNNTRLVVNDGLQTFMFNGGNVGIGDSTPSSALTVGDGDLFQVDASGAVAAATGITSSGTITFSGLTAGGVVSAGAGTGTLTVGTLGGSGITPDSLDFTEFQDTLDLDADLVLNQTTNTWSQSFTGTTTTGLTYTASSLTSGVGVNITSAATGMTGDIGKIELSGANAGNTGNVLKVGFTGTAGTAVALNVTNAGTAATARFNDDGTYTDSTPVVIDASGQVGIGTSAPGSALQVNGTVTVGSSNSATITNSVFTTGTSYTIGNSSNGLVLGGSSGQVQVTSSSASSNAILLQATGAATAASINIGGGGAYTNTTGTREYVNHDAGFAPTSGSGVFTQLAFKGTFDQTGGANGITRAIHVNPTLTSVADYRAIDIAANSANAFGIYQSGSSTKNYFNGNTGIGDSTPASLLTVGSGDLFQVDSNGDPVKIKNVTYSWPSSQGGSGTVLTNNGSGVLSWGTPQVGDITSVGDVTSGAAFDGTQGNSLQFEGATPDGFETTLTADDPTADRTITLPNITGTLITTGDTGTVTSTMLTDNTITGTDTADDTFDFVDFEDTLDLDAALVLNQTTNTWSQSFTGTTTTGLTYTASSLTSGVGVNITSAATGMTGDIGKVELTGANAGNTGNVLKVGYTGTTGTATPLNVTNGGTGLSFRINDDGTYADTTAFVINSSGNVGVGNTSPSALFSVGSSSQFQIDSSGKVSSSSDIDTSSKVHASVALVGGSTADSGYKLTNGGGFAGYWGAFHNNTASTLGSKAMYINPASNELVFAAGNGTNYIARAAIQITNLTNTAGSETGDLILLTQTGGTAMSEKMRVQAAGNVGIGDTDPASLFTVGSGDLFQVNSSGDPVKIKNVTYSWPSSNSSGALTNDGTGGLSWAAGTVAADSLDFVDFQDTLDLDAALVLNQTTNTWSQSFTGTTTTGLTYTADSLTTGTGISVASAATGLTGNLTKIELSGANTGNTGNVLKVGYTGTTGTATALNVTNAGTGSSFRVNDDGTYTDTSVFVIDSSGYVGIGTGTAPTTLLNENNGVLTVNGNNPTRIAINSPSNSGFVLAEGGTSMYSVASYSGGKFTIYDDVNNVDRFFIASTGEIGIGDTTPASLFTVGSGDLFQVNSSGDPVKIKNVTYSWPSSNSSGALTNDGTGGLSWAAGTVAADSLDFVDFQDTLDLDAALVLNQTTNTWSQSFTGTTTTGLTYTADSLTTGTGISVASAATGLTGNLTKIELSGANTGNTGDVLKVGFTGTTGSATALNVTNGGTGFSLRVNDDGTYTDTSAFVVNASGNVGIGTTAPPAGYKLDVVGGIARFDQDQGIIMAGYTTTFVNNYINFYAGGAQSTIQGFNASPGVAIGYAATTTNPGGANTTLSIKGANALSSGKVLMIENSASTRLLTVQNDGTIGIGDSDPASMLTVGSGDLFQVNSSGDPVKIKNVTYSWPSSNSSGVLTNDGTGGLSWAAGTVAADSLDFVDFQDTLDLDAALVFNQTTNTWSQSFTGTTTTGLTYTADSLTTGTGISVASAATGLTGNLTKIELSGANTGNTGDVLKVGFTGTTGTAIALNVTNAGTAATARFNDDGTYTDSTPVVIDASGQVGIGTSAPGSALQVNGTVTVGASSSATITNSAFTTGASYTIGNSANQMTISSMHTASNAIVLSTGTEPSAGVTIGNTGYTSTTLSKKALRFVETYTASSGTGTFTALAIDNAFNLTSSASGVQRGIDINPTLTSLAGGAIFRGIDIQANHASAYGIYQSGSSTLNYFNGNVGLGDSSPASLLTVGSGDLFQVNSSGDPVKIKNVTYSWPSSNSSGVLTNDGTGGLSWSAGTVAADSLDFVDFQDTLDLDAALVLNQTTNTWSQSFTGTTTTGLTYTADSLTTGTGISVASAATGLTGNLTKIELSGANTGNTGDVLKVGFTGTTGSATPLNVTNAGTGLSFRVNDDGTYADTTAVVVDASGNVGIGTTAPTSALYLNAGTDTSTSAAFTAAYLTATKSVSSTNSNATYFAQNYFSVAGSGAHGNAIGLMNQVVVSGTSVSNVVRSIYGRISMSGSGAASSVTSFASHFEGDASGTISKYYGMSLGNVSGVSAFTNATNTITDTYGLYIGDITAGTQTNTPFSIYQEDTGTKNYFAASVGVGDSTPASLLTVGSGDLFQVNSSGDPVKIKNVTYSWPSSNSSGVLTNNGSGTLTWAAASITADSLDFIDFEDTLDLDAALVLNQTTNTWSQTFTGTTTTGLTYTASSLTSGVAVNVTSAATGMTGDISKVELTGANTGNTGNVLKVGYTGTTGTATALNVTNGGTGLSFRVNDDGTYADTSAVVVDASGNMGVGTTAPSTAIHAIVSTSNTSTVQDVLTLAANSTGTAANGFGPSILFKAESSTTDNRDVAAIQAYWSVATDSSRRGEIMFQFAQAGTLTNAYKFSGAGNGFVLYDASGGTPTTLSVVNLTTSQAYTIGNSSFGLTLGGSSGTVTTSTSSTTSPAIDLSSSSATPAIGVRIGSTGYTSTTLGKSALQFSDTYTAASGTGSLTAINIGNSYNLTSSASGTQKGIDINPTLTSLAGGAIYRSIDIQANNASAYGIYQSGSSTLNYFAGNVGLGDSTPASLLTVGSGDLFQVNSSGDPVKIKNVTYSWPSSNSSGVLTNNGSGTLTWAAASITADSLDFIDFEDTLDLDAALVLNQTTNTWSQSFTGTTTTGLTYTASSLTSGVAVNVTSAATGMTGDISKVELTGANTGNTGNVLKVGYTGTTGTAVAMNVTNGGTGLTARFNDDGTYADTTPVAVDASGNLGVGTSAPSSLLNVADTTATNNAVRTVATVAANVSGGSATTGFGPGFLFQGETSTTDNRDMVALNAKWEDATDASRASRLSILGVHNASSVSMLDVVAGSSGNSYMSIGGGGTLFYNSTIQPGTAFTLGGTSSTLTLSTSASSAGSISLSTSGAAGSIYINNATNVSNATNKNNLVFPGSFVPSSTGTNTFKYMNISGTINQSSGHTGNTWGIEIAPTLTSLGGTFYALDIAANSSSAYGVYQSGSSTKNYFNGNTGIGDSSPASLLTVGSGDLFQVNSSGDMVKIKNVTYSWPSSNSSGALTNDGTGGLSWAAASISADSLDFVDFQDTLDLDAALVLNQTTNTWSQTFTGTTTTGLTYTANSLTTGTAISVSSSSLTSGTLLNISSGGTGALTNQKGLNIALSGANGTGGQSTYGAYVSNTHSGTVTNYGGYFEAIVTGGNQAYGLYTTASSGLNSVGTYSGATASSASAFPIAGQFVTTGNGDENTGVVITVTGGSNINKGLTVSASGASENYSILTTAGNVGIGEQSPASLLTVGAGDLFQVNSSGDMVKIKNVTYSWPSSNSSGALTNDGTGGLSWAAASISADSLDFVDFQDTLDLDTNLTLNQTTSTWTQSYTGTTGVGHGFIADNLISGTGVYVTSATNLLTGQLMYVELSDDGAGNTGSALKVGVIGTIGTATALNVTNGATGLSFRVNDDGTYTDTTPVVVDAAGQVGIGTSAPGSLLNVINNSLTSGNIVGVSSSATGVTGDLGKIELTGANTGNTGTVLKVGYTGTTGTAVAMNVTNGGTGLSFRVNDDGTYADTSPVVIDQDGNVGIGNSTPRGTLDVYRGGANGNIYLEGGEFVYIGDYSSNFAHTYMLIDGDGGGFSFFNGNVGIGDASPDFKLELEGTSNVLDRKIGINDTQVIYLPDQGSGAFAGSIFVGNGGGSLSHSSGNDGYSNTGVGILALSGVTTGGTNTAIGYQTLYSNTTGYNNTAVGNTALLLMVSGNSNTAIGESALINSTGLSNTGLGAHAGFNQTSGNNNTFVGWQSGLGITTGGSNTIIGANVTGLSSTLSNNVIIADGDGNRRINVDSSGNVGIATSAPGGVLDVNSNGVTSGIGLKVSSTATGLTGELGKIELTGANTGNTGTVLKVGYTGTTGTAVAMNVTNAGTGLSFRVNDNGTYTDTSAVVVDASGNMGVGTTVPQYTLEVGATTGTDSSFALTDEDLAHGLTDLAQTNVYGIFRPNASSGGGLQIAGFATSKTGVYVYGYLATTDPADGLPAIELIGAKKNSTDVQDLGNTETVFQVANNDNNPAITVLGNASVGFGTTAPAAPIDILGADNAISQNITINATSANITGADTFINFGSSNQATIGSITGTGVSGVIAYNTFTGSHWTKIDDKTGLDVAMVLEATGEKFFDGKDQLVKSRLCSKRQSQAVYGVYGGVNAQGQDMVLALGTGLIWVTNTGGDIEVGDYLQCSDDPGYAEKQSDDILHNHTVAKAMEPVKWQPGETRRKIACTYHAG